MACDRSREAGRAVPVFPLNPVTLFPHLLVPLHIFEPRYFQMVTHALQGDDSIAMAHYENPEDSQAPGRPPLRPVVGIGRILRSVQLPGDRYHLVLRGVTRARVAAEEDSGHLYRALRLERISDGPVLLSARDELTLRDRLLELSANVLAQQVEDGERVLREHIARPGIDIGVLADQVAATVPLTPSARYELLAELDPVARCERLMTRLERCQATLRTEGPSAHLFPSSN